MTQFDSVWLNLTQFDSVWLNWTQLDSVWLFKSFWYNLTYFDFDSFWYNLDHFGSYLKKKIDTIWIILTLFSLVLIFTKFESFWNKLNQFNSTWLSLNHTKNSGSGFKRSRDLQMLISSFYFDLLYVQFVSLSGISVTIGLSYLGNFNFCSISFQEQEAKSKLVQFKTRNWLLKVSTKYVLSVFETMKCEPPTGSKGKLGPVIKINLRKWLFDQKNGIITCNPLRPI